MSRETFIFFNFVFMTLLFRSILAQGPRSRNLYASILQDSRNEPTPDGTFGYLYKTEDGIVSSARGGPNGVIQGGFSYTDPTGLKVNINYNAGSRTIPSAVEPSERRAPAASRSNGNEVGARPRAPAPVYRPEPQYYDEPVEDAQYEQSAPRYITRPQPVYRPQTVYQQRRNRPTQNEIYDDYSYRR